MPGSTTLRILSTALAAVLGPAAAAAPFAGDRPGTIETLPAAPDPHWVWVHDMNYDNMADGRAILVDGDGGRVLGMLYAGYSFNQLTIPRDAAAIYSAETHYSRTTRGTRTDVVTIYDPRTLAPSGEIPLPPKRGSTIPTLHNAVLTDDDRFMLVFNITPATSVSVVDVRERRYAGEIETPGCSLIYPAGPRRFFMLCMDGSALVVTLDDRGGAAGKERTPVFFDPQVDPLSEKGVRIGGRWYFTSFEGWLHTVDVSGPALAFPERWSLLDAGERAANWRVGGRQQIAAHAASGQIFVLTHQADPKLNTRKDPGQDVRVYDVAQRKRTRMFRLKDLTDSLQLSQDAQPLLFAAFVAVDAVNVYDAASGTWLRRVTDVGSTPTSLAVPWTGAQSAGGGAK